MHAPWRGCLGKSLGVNWRFAGGQGGQVEDERGARDSVAAAEGYSVVWLQWAVCRAEEGEEAGMVTVRPALKWSVLLWQERPPCALSILSVSQEYFCGWCDDPVFKCSHIRRPWGLGLQHMNMWGDTIQPIRDGEGLMAEGVVGWRGGLDPTEVRSWAP